MSEFKQENNELNRESVLITGGSGLIGKYLPASLLAAGYNVSHLSRKNYKIEKVKVFHWEPEKRIIDPDTVKGIDFIIHLAGANIGEKRWSVRRKKEILESRVTSAWLLYDTVAAGNVKLKAFISASASGIYGVKRPDLVFNENDPPAEDFLGSVCKLWEESADLFSASGIRTVKIRTGVVLEKNDSALSKLMKPGKIGFLVQTGTGRQYMPWIHISDLCKIYLKAIEDPDMAGAYNAVAPQQVTHFNFMHVLAKIMRVPLLPVPVPGFILRVVLGEMSDVILYGNRVSSEKLINAGYRFRFKIIEAALDNVIRG
jgi:uncharacterized protein